jgi:hypothetical protein
MPRLAFCCELPAEELAAQLDDGSVLADLASLGPRSAWRSWRQLRPN